MTEELRSLPLKELVDTDDVKDHSREALSVEIRGVCTDSRRVRPGDLFVALPGCLRHGNEFAADALRRGAGGVVTGPDSSFKSMAARPAGILVVADPRKILLRALERFYPGPGTRPRVVGVTGTNGKTTVTYLLEAIFRRAGRRSGVIGTISQRFGDKVFRPTNTTPGIVDNYRMLSEMAAADMDYAFMEVSSHALHQRRVEGIDFSAAVFTNLTQDHLDYHKSIEDYFKAKAVLFSEPGPSAFAVINTDDPYGRRLFSLTPAHCVTYGIREKADIMAVDIEAELNQTSFTVVSPGVRVRIGTRLFGRHNVYNILAAFAVGLEQGLTGDAIREGINALAYVPGRMEAVPTRRGWHVFIDYAHTPDALKNVLTNIRQVHRQKILLVFGCGGDRDKGKRPLMGRIASRLADYTFVTNDNPRSEEPKEIADQIVSGFETSDYEVILDRRTAIAAALKRALSGDVILIAGKGHEDYQIFKDQIVPFHERRIVEELLAF